MNHDPLCYVAQNGGNCCPWLPACDCQCMCEYIKEVRDDTIASLTALEWYSKARWTGYHDGLNATEAAVAEIENDPDAQVDYDRDYTADPSGSTRNPRIWLRSAIDAIRALKEKQ